MQKANYLWAKRHSRRLGEESQNVMNNQLGREITDIANELAKERNHQLSILYATNILFRDERKRKPFSGKRK